MQALATDAGPVLTCSVELFCMHHVWTTLQHPAQMAGPAQALTHKQELECKAAGWPGQASHTQTTPAAQTGRSRFHASVAREQPKGACTHGFRVWG